MKFSRQTENLIANLRGLPENRSRSRIRPAAPMETLVEKILQRYKIDKPRLEDTLMANWKSIVGEKNAHRCRPTRLVEKETKLLIFTANTIVRSELQFNQRKIIQKINTLPDCQKIKAIGFQAG